MPAKSEQISGRIQKKTITQKIKCLKISKLIENTFAHTNALRTENNLRIYHQIHWYRTKWDKLYSFYYDFVTRSEVSECLQTLWLYYNFAIHNECVISQLYRADFEQNFNCRCPSRILSRKHDLYKHCTQVSLLGRAHYSGEMGV